MKRARTSRRQTLLWVVSILVVTSMVCGVLASLQPQQAPSAPVAPTYVEPPRATDTPPVTPALKTIPSVTPTPGADSTPEPNPLARPTP